MTAKHTYMSPAHEQRCPWLHQPASSSCPCGVASPAQAMERSTRCTAARMSAGLILVTTCTSCTRRPARTCAWWRAREVGRMSGLVCERQARLGKAPRLACWAEGAPSACNPTCAMHASPGHMARRQQAPNRQMAASRLSSARAADRLHSRRMADRLPTPRAAAHRQVESVVQLLLGDPQLQVLQESGRDARSERSWAGGSSGKHGAHKCPWRSPCVATSLRACNGGHMQRWPPFEQCYGPAPGNLARPPTWLTVRFSSTERPRVTPSTPGCRDSACRRSEARRAGVLTTIRKSGCFPSKVQCSSNCPCGRAPQPSIQHPPRGFRPHPAARRPTPPQAARTWPAGRGASMGTHSRSAVYAASMRQQATAQQCRLLLPRLQEHRTISRAVCGWVSGVTPQHAQHSKHSAHSTA